MHQPVLKELYISVFAPEILLLTTTPTELEVLRNQKTKKGNIARNELLYCLRERGANTSIPFAEQTKIVQYLFPPRTIAESTFGGNVRKGGGGEMCVLQPNIRN